MYTLNQAMRQLAATLAAIVALIRFLGSEFERAHGSSAAHSVTGRRPPAGTV
jgi:hypothetical protein